MAPVRNFHFKTPSVMNVYKTPSMDSMRQEISWTSLFKHYYRRHCWYYKISRSK